jgi:ABC-2 type transport system permease protein
VTGQWILLRHFLRRDRWVALWFAVGVAVLYWAQAVSIDDLYSTQEAFDEAADAMAANTAFVAMAGPARALNTTGGQVAWQATAFGAIAAGLVSMFVIGRHTRAAEESGREELLRGSPVHRRAGMTAALLTALILNALAGAAVSAGLIGYGLAVPGSLIMGVGLMLGGWFFSGVALLAMQLTESTRAAYGITATVIGASYALRAAGDVTAGWLSWLSPIGWYQAMWGYSGDRWWPGLLLLAGAAALVAAAFAVFERRDFASGVIQARPGPDRARDGMVGALGFAWHLQRPSALAWLVGLFLLGLTFGTFGEDVSILGDSELTEAWAPDPDSLVDSFYATMAILVALIGAAFTVSSALRPRSEEDDRRVEALLATGLPRRHWLLGHLSVTVLVTVALLTVIGVGMGLGYAAFTGDQTAIWRYTGAVLAVAPGVLLIGGVAVLLYGLAMRWAGLAWLLLVFCVVVLLFGELLRFPQWLRDLSPFTHFALVPAHPMAWGPFLIVLAVALGAAAVGVLAFQRRDLRC